MFWASRRLSGNPALHCSLCVCASSHVNDMTFSSVKVFLDSCPYTCVASHADSPAASSVSVAGEMRDCMTVGHLFNLNSWVVAKTEALTKVPTNA